MLVMKQLRRMMNGFQQRGQHPRPQESKRKIIPSEKETDERTTSKQFRPCSNRSQW